MLRERERKKEMEKRKCQGKKTKVQNKYNEKVKRRYFKNQTKPQYQKLILTTYARMKRLTTEKMLETDA